MPTRRVTQHKSAQHILGNISKREYKRNNNRSKPTFQLDQNLYGTSLAQADAKIFETKSASHRCNQACQPQTPAKDTKAKSAIVNAGARNFVEQHWLNYRFYLGWYTLHIQS